MVDESDVLGTGCNGSVFKASGKIPNADGSNPNFAIKGFALEGLSPSKKAELTGEVQIFLAMDHPHVARLIAVYENPKQMYLVMECMEGGELFTRVQAQKSFNEKESAHSVWQMLLAVNYIHSHGVVHRDLKLENFLYERKDNDHLKLIDFGFSKAFDGEKMDLSCGTLAYCAPDVLNKSYTSQVDLWSMGVITFILLLGYMPFSGTDENQKSHILAGSFKKKKPLWDNISSGAQEFIRSLIEVDPTKRLSANQALTHPWIAKRDQTGRRYVTPLGELSKGGENRLDNLNVDEATVAALCSFSQLSRFRRACMSLMAWSLSTTERQLVRDAFIEMDVHRTGAIKLDEFKNILMSRFEIEESQSQMIVEALAVTQKGVIHYSEFLAAMVSTRIQMTPDHYKATFKRFDTQKRGFINEKDLSKVLGQAFSEEELQKIVDAMDWSGKGEVKFEDFCAYLDPERKMGRASSGSKTGVDVESPMGGSEGNQDTAQAITGGPSTSNLSQSSIGSGSQGQEGMVKNQMLAIDRKKSQEADEDDGDDGLCTVISRVNPGGNRDRAGSDDSKGSKTCSVM